MRITRRVTFCAGHRVVGHEGKCKNVHGHNYVVELTAEATSLDSLGRVIDFSVLKERLGGWIDENWDHGFIAWVNDGVMAAFLTGTAMKYYTLDANPTAENMADHLLMNVGPVVLGDTDVTLVSVKLFETENCWAEVSL